MAWTEEDYKAMGMKSPAQEMAEKSVVRPAKPLVQPQKKTGFLASAYNNALVERLRKSGAE